MPEVSDANITLVRLTYDSYARRDLAMIWKHLSPQIEIYQASEVPWGGTYRGHDGALEFFRKLNAFTDASPMPEEYFAAGEDVVVIGRARGTVQTTGRPFDLRIVHLWTVREGLIARFAAYVDAVGVSMALGG